MYFTMKSSLAVVFLLCLAVATSGASDQRLSLQHWDSAVCLSDLEADEQQAGYSSPNANNYTGSIFSRPSTTTVDDQQCGITDVKVSFLPSDSNDGTFKSYPLVVTPQSTEQQSVEFLAFFMEHNREWVSAMMLKYGAVLFRDFGVLTAQDVEDAVLSYEPRQLSDIYRGTSPRHAQGGTKYVFSAAEVPSHYPIAQHLEMSFLPEPPKKLFFSALSAPKTIGGETAISDFRQVYRDLPPMLREKLQTKKLRYTRTHTENGLRITNDVAAMLGWSEMFRTANKTLVEELAAAEEMPMRWEGPKMDIFVSEFQTEAFQLHPETNEPAWFNHIQVFHWTSFPAELYAAYRRTGDLRYLGRALYSGISSWIKYDVLGYQMSLHVSFGDGEPISIWEAHQMRQAIHKNTYYNRWEQGDIVAIDNFSTAHGRSPTYDSGRNIVVAWSEPLRKADAMANLHLDVPSIPQLAAIEINADFGEHQPQHF